MAMLINDPAIEATLITERQRIGADHFDEVWDGVYVMAPNPGNEHQSVQSELVTILTTLVSWAGLGVVHGGCNVTDQEVDWTRNYRVPDVAVFLHGNLAEDRRSHWYGGPDFAIEVISANDRSRDKLDFYERVRVRELLLIDRDPWEMELYRLQDNALVRVASATAANQIALSSSVVPLSFSLVAAVPRPKLNVVGREGRVWLI